MMTDAEFAKLQKEAMSNGGLLLVPMTKLRGRVKRKQIQRQAAEGFVRPQVVDSATGEVVRDYGWQRNLHLDQGLNGVASRAWCDNFLCAAAGTGTVPTKDDSGSTTLTQSGTTVTSSVGFFSNASSAGAGAGNAGDVGKLIKWDSGAQAKITAYVSTTQVTVDRSQSVSAGEATLYRVNQTRLADSGNNTTELVRADMSDLLTGAGNCGSTRTGNVLASRRTWDFPAESGSVTYTEVGFSHVAADAGSDLFSRILLTTPVDLIAGQQLRLSYELRLTITPEIETATTFPITNWEDGTVDGFHMFQYLGLSAISTSGVTIAWDAGGFANEPSYGGGLTEVAPTGELDPTTDTYDRLGADIWITTDNAAFSAFAVAPPDRTSATVKAAGQASLAAYTNGNFYRDKQLTFTLSQANSANLRTFGIGASADPDDDEYPYTAAKNTTFACRMTNPQTKVNTHTLTLVFRITWDRTLTN